MMHFPDYIIVLGNGMIIHLLIDNKASSKKDEETIKDDIQLLKTP